MHKARRQLADDASRGCRRERNTACMKAGKHTTRSFVYLYCCSCSTSFHQRSVYVDITPEEGQARRCCRCRVVVQSKNATNSYSEADAYSCVFVGVVERPAVLLVAVSQSVRACWKAQ